MVLNLLFNTHRHLNLIRLHLCFPYLGGVWLNGRQKNLRSGLQHHEPLHVKRRVEPTLFDEGLNMGFRLLSPNRGDVIGLALRSCPSNCNHRQGMANCC
jgi:hypothetical protein